MMYAVLINIATFASTLFETSSSTAESEMIIFKDSVVVNNQENVQPPKPFLPVPSQCQMDWHKAEYRMFIHFGMKTFYPNNNHMGNGKEDPRKFNPVHFNADQWVETVKAGGFEGVVLTLKHHEGFCIWQTNTTDFSVKSSPWMDGKGDVLKDVIEACRKGGVTVGVYMSLIDKHFDLAESPTHINYGDYYYDQLKEISTRYGSIDEYWFDGFKADKLKMDYSKITNLIREKQPHAVIYDSGTMVKYLPERCLAWKGEHGGGSADQEYRREIEGKLRWYPNEPSLILQGNWFHDGNEIVSLSHIQDYYLTTVGHGVTPLMNISPNQEGLFDKESIERLQEFKAWVDRLHANDLAHKIGVKVTAADNIRGHDAKYGPQSAVDSKYDTYYATDDDVKNAVIEIDLGKVQEIDGFILQEYIPLGQRVDGYSIECLVDGIWKEVFSGKKIGYKRIIIKERASAKDIIIPATDRVRLKITNALACPLINSFKVIGSLKSNKFSN